MDKRVRFRAEMLVLGIILDVSSRTIQKSLAFGGMSLALNIKSLLTIVDMQ